MARRRCGLIWLAGILMSSGLTAQRVDMSSSSLTSLPAGNLTEDTTELLLSHNSIRMSPEDVDTLRRCARITVLDLSYNLIQSLPSRAFDSLRNLQKLQLRGNRLQTLDRDIFTALANLKSVDLEGNPWNCSCSFTGLLQWLNESGISTGKGVVCYSWQSTAARDGNCSTVPPVAGSTAKTVGSTSSDGFTARGAGPATGSSSWKFLLGIVALTLSISTLIVCAVKSPSWYKLLFDYRHQRLREDVDPSVFNTTRFSNFSLDTEQTETSAQELDDDGFIEDGYIIEPANYSEPAEAHVVSTISAGHVRNDMSA